MPNKIYNLPLPPWQIRIAYSEEMGHLIIAEILHHAHPSVVFTRSAAEHLGGVTGVDDDDYITGVVNDDYAMIHAARLIVDSMQGRENLNKANQSA